MRGLDDGPDGLNDAAFDRALGLKPAKKPASKGYLEYFEIYNARDEDWAREFAADQRKMGMVAKVVKRTVAADGVKATAIVVVVRRQVPAVTP